MHVKIHNKKPQATVCNFYSLYYRNKTTCTSIECQQCDVQPVRVYLPFPFIDFMLLPFCPYIAIYIYFNSFNNNISLFHNIV